MSLRSWRSSHLRRQTVVRKIALAELRNLELRPYDPSTRSVSRRSRSRRGRASWTWTTQGEYWYDANGALAKSVKDSTAIEYVYLCHDPLCERTGTTYTDYIYVNGRMMVKQVGSDIYYYFKDALGSTRQVWKAGATKAAFSVATDAPFGTPVTPSGTEKFKYAGEMLAGAAGTSPGLYYIGARWMDPELGRFVSLDPQLGSLSSPQTMNRYVYCVNNPLRFTDPTGEGFWSGAKKWWDERDVPGAATSIATRETPGVPPGRMCGPEGARTAIHPEAQ